MSFILTSTNCKTACTLHVFIGCKLKKLITMGIRNDLLQKYRFFYFVIDTQCWRQLNQDLVSLICLMSVLLSLHILVLFSLRRYCLRFCLFSSFIIHAVITLFKFHYVTSGINEIRHHVFLSVELCHLRSCCLLSLSFLDIVSSISTLFGARYRFCFLSFF